jgi:3-dehydroquinate dehydratase
VVSPHAAAVIAGYGIDGYRMAREQLSRAGG